MHKESDREGDRDGEEEREGERETETKEKKKGTWINGTKGKRVVVDNNLHGIKRLFCNELYCSNQCRVRC